MAAERLLGAASFMLAWIRRLLGCVPRHFPSIDDAASFHVACLNPQSIRRVGATSAILATLESEGHQPK